MPALLPDPSGGPQKFDASFAAWIASMRVAGRSFRSIASDLKIEEGLDVPEPVLRGLFLAVAETVAPVCSALFLHTLPDWNSLRRMFEEAQSAGDWLAEEFLNKSHALNMLEENARVRADRLGGAPEDLYRERRIARAQSQRIAGDLFARCRELSPSLAPETPLAETLRYAVEHESVLCEYLYDPRVEIAVAPPDDLRPDPFLLEYGYHLVQSSRRASVLVRASVDQQYLCHIASLSFLSFLHVSARKNALPDGRLYILYPNPCREGIQLVLRIMYTETD